MAVPPGTETASAPQGSVHPCPGCGLPLTEETLVGTSYHCTQCGLEVAHLQTTAPGAPVGVIRWLLNPGDMVLDRYRIEKVLGKGGFAATYLAQDLRVNGKKRALKEIPETLYDATETKLLSHLSHPAIPDITDQSREGGMVYLVLELGGGRTLEAERKLAGGRLPYQRVLGWMMQLGPAISYLHAQDPPIIHRDLKPDNILLDDQGRIMLIDFGIAKQAVAGGQTRVVARAATHGFSPPEQAMGTGTDPRSDVYALAATAYALITGVIPTPAHERIAGKALADPAELVPDLPPRVAEALLQALTLNINQRPANVEQLIRSLGLAVVPPGDFAATTRTVIVEDAATLASIPQATSVRIRSERVTVAPSAPVVRAGPRAGVWVAGALAVLALGAGGAWFLLKQPPGSTSTAPANPPRSAAVQPPESPVAPAVPPAAAIPPETAVLQPPGPGQGLPPGADAVTKTTSTRPGRGTSATTPHAGVEQAKSRPTNASPTTGTPEQKSAAQPPTTSAIDILTRFRPEKPEPPPVAPPAKPKRVEKTLAVRPPPKRTKPTRRSPAKKSGSTTSAAAWGWKKGGSYHTD